jgi:coenzyme F420-reducing hydrogenase delta subunit
MGVGPAGRTGRDQLAAARAIADAARPAGREIAIVACHHGAAEAKERLAGAGRRFLDGGCAGSLHTSVVELLLRRGFAGVFVVTCPPRDCSFREGPKWLAARIHDGREAELPPRVDRRRVAAAPFSIVGAGGIVHRLADFERELAALAIEIEAAPEITAECDREAAERVLAEVANG